MTQHTASAPPPWADAVKPFLTARRRSEARFNEDPDGLENCRQTPPDQRLDESRVGLLRDALGDTDTMDQAITWNPGRWIAGTESTDRRLHEGVIELATTSGWDPNTPSVTISRRQVLGRSDPFDLFLASMVWGFGPTGYGWHRTAKLVRAAAERPVTIDQTVAAYQAAAAEGPEEVWRTWSYGPHRIPGLYTAFASKVAYFASYQCDLADRPLISDLNTRWGMWVLTGYWVSEPRRRSKAAGARLPKGYGDYVRWCHATARALDLEPHDVELATFQIGKAARALPI